MENTPEQQEWTIPSGSLVKIDGIPYWTKSDTTVIGFKEPCFEARQYVDGESSNGQV